MTSFLNKLSFSKKPLIKQQYLSFLQRETSNLNNQTSSNKHILNNTSIAKKLKKHTGF